MRIFEENITPMKFTAILFLFFGLLSLGLGIAMVVDHTLLNQFDSPIRTGFIILLFVYCAYRLWSAISVVRKNAARRAAAK